MFNTSQGAWYIVMPSGEKILLPDSIKKDFGLPFDTAVKVNGPQGNRPPRG